MIGLVLANARALANASGLTSGLGRAGPRGHNGSRAPLILLLDEIAAHLDPERRAALFDIIDGLGFQAFMTGTDKSLFSAWGGGAQYFETRDGSLCEADLT